MAIILTTALRGSYETIVIDGLTKFSKLYSV